MIPDRYRLAAVGVLVAGALLAAACAGAWLNGLRWQGRLAVAERVHADTLAEISRAAATQLATQQAAQQRLTQALAAVDNQHYQELDKRIAARSHHWRVERMSAVDRNILRIAAYELEWAEDAPAQVVINEALEIAKRYSIADSVSFINGILDGMHAPRQGSPDS